MNTFRKQQLKYLIADILSAELVWICFLVFRWLVYEGRVFSMDAVLIPVFNFWLPLCLYPIGCIVVYYLSGYYLRPFNKKLGKEFITTFFSSCLVALVTFFIVIIDDQVQDYSRYLWSLLVLFGLQFILCYIPRLCITLISRHRMLEQPSCIIEQTPTMSDNDFYHAIAKAYQKGEAIYVVPRVYDILTGAAQIGELTETPYICISDLSMSDVGLCSKRAMDIVISVVTLVLFSPLYLIIAILVKLSSPGPIIYRQERIGKHGKPFMILKFRTMCQGAEEEGPQLSADDDPRITRVGRCLRKYRLDELPQFFNVLRGDMSIVGPRPERPFFIKQIEQEAPYYCLLYKIRPGLTSWGPIKVGYTDTIEKMVERLKYDIAYMENMSIVLDLKILFYTIGVILDGKGK